MKKLLLLLLAILLLPPSLWAQGNVYKDNILNQFGQPVAFAQITVCAAAALGSPCSPAINTIYSDPALTQSLANPFKADNLGNYSFWAAPGTYTLSISGNGITTYTATVSIPCLPNSVICGNGISVNTANTWTAVQTFNAGLASGGPNALLGGGTFDGTYAGSPTFTGIATFNNNATFNGTASFDGISSTGPNVLTGGGRFDGAYTSNPTFTFAGNNAGVFTNTQMNQPYNFNVNGYSWPTGGVGGSYYQTQVISVGLACPSSAVLYQCVSVDAEYVNASTVTNSVGGYFVGYAGANGVHDWGLNTVTTDQDEDASLVVETPEKK
jgi:hypothetical protein